MATTQDDVIAELQRANAALQERLDAELATRTSEAGEQIAQQAATIDVLQVMSASPGDARPALTLIAHLALELCNAFSLGMFTFDGTLLDCAVACRPDWTEEQTRAFLSNFPKQLDPESVRDRAILERRVIHVRDMDAEPGASEAAMRIGPKSLLCLPLLRDAAATGLISIEAMPRGGFSDSQVALLKTFAEQAAIAIGSAETWRALQTRTAELQESLEYQTATSDVLKVIRCSTFDLQPVLDTVVETAARLCDAEQSVIYRRDGALWRLAANFGFPPEYEAFYKSLGAFPDDPDSPMVGMVAARERRYVHVHDVAAVPGYPDAVVRLGKVRTSLGVPLLRDAETIGCIVLARQRVQPFTGRQIDLVSTFADQAVIAMENTRLLTEQQEALERQTATAEVLQAINASPGNLEPVFQAIVEKAHTLCDAAYGSLQLWDGEKFRGVAMRGFSEAMIERLRVGYSPWPRMPCLRLVEGERVAHCADLAEVDDPTARVGVTLGGVRTILYVALRKDDVLLGQIVAARQEVRPFTGKQIALVESFATQAVIAMENARLLHELRARTDELAQRQAELRVTFENMGDGVAMFDETLRLAAWNRQFQDIFDIPDGVLTERLTFLDYIRFIVGRGGFGADADPEEQVRRLIEGAGQHGTYERTRSDGTVIEIRHNLVPGGGFVLIYADITERKRNEVAIRAARDAAEQASRTIEAAYRDLKIAQANLIQAEKMASLGQLTAGIAHEIKNPLNFVNNFSALSTELIDELREVLAPETLSETVRAEVDDLTGLLKSNLQKVVQHGQRADGIVKAMLEHSRGASGERRAVDINALVDETLNLAYHGARAQDQSFNITLERDFQTGIAPIELNPQDITRVFLNLFSNGFYAAAERERKGADDFKPTLTVTTRDAGDSVEVRVRDNGTGIPAGIRDKLFQPFFTTKPSGQGTGLGLSITYDIITKAHGGAISVGSEVDDFTEFVVALPRAMFASEGSPG